MKSGMKYRYLHKTYISATLENRSRRAALWNLVLTVIVAACQEHWRFKNVQVVMLGRHYFIDKGKRCKIPGSETVASVLYQQSCWLHTSTHRVAQDPGIRLLDTVHTMCLQHSWGTSAKEAHMFYTKDAKILLRVPGESHCLCYIDSR